MQIRVVGALVRAGGGATIGEINLAIERNRAAVGGLPALVVGGLDSSVGLGLVLQGGVGPLSRLFGLACDQLVAATIVTGDGAVHALSATSEGLEPLWWGVRGGGNSLGVVVSVTLRVHTLARAPPQAALGPAAAALWVDAVTVSLSPELLLTMLHLAVARLKRHESLNLRLEREAESVRGFSKLLLPCFALLTDLYHAFGSTW